MSTPSDPQFQPGPEPQWVRLQTLVNLRWLAIAGQLVAVGMATQILHLDLRLDICLLLIACSALFNLGATAIHPLNKRLNQRDAALTLLFDLAQLTALLYFTGGMTNPFAVLILAQTIIAATVLTLRATLILGTLSVAAITLLALDHVPLHTVAGDILTIPPLLLVGVWAATSISVVFLGIYARRVSLERFSMAEALTATQLALEREQKLTALGGVVAAAAHELGTPLATIKLVTSELLQDRADDADLVAEVDLIREQAERCRVILQSMGRTGKQDLHVRHAPFSAVVEEAAQPHRDRGKSVILRIKGTLPEDRPGGEEPEISRRPEIVHGVRNLVQNAVDFARATVWIDLDWNTRKLTLKVSDDGWGFPSDVLGRIGDPFVGRRSRRNRGGRRPGYEGMGLGLFIAKTLLERTGARLTFANGATGRGRASRSGNAAPTGAVVEVVWDRSDIAVGRETTRAALGDNQASEMQAGPRTPVQS